LKEPREVSILEGGGYVRWVMYCFSKLIQQKLDKIKRHGRFVLGKKIEGFLLHLYNH